MLHGTSQQRRAVAVCFNCVVVCCPAHTATPAHAHPGGLMEHKNEFLPISTHTRLKPDRDKIRNAPSGRGTPAHAHPGGLLAVTHLWIDPYDYISHSKDPEDGAKNRLCDN